MKYHQEESSPVEGSLLYHHPKDPLSKVNSFTLVKVSGPGANISNSGRSSLTLKAYNLLSRRRVPTEWKDFFPKRTVSNEGKSTFNKVKYDYPLVRE